MRLLTGSNKNTHKVVTTKDLCSTAPFHEKSFEILTFHKLEECRMRMFDYEWVTFIFGTRCGNSKMGLELFECMGSPVTKVHTTKRHIMQPQRE